MTTQEFPHQHTAHCESGVMSTLLKYHGHNLDEAMIFGIAHALTFVWLPVVKLGGMPLVSYRIAPRGIIKNTCKALGLKLSVRKFSNAQKGQDALDAALSSGKLAGLPPSAFWVFVKMAAVLYWYLWIRATFPRYRYDQIMRLGWKVLIPIGFAYIVILGVWMISPLNLWK